MRDENNYFTWRAGILAVLACLLVLPALAQIGPGPFAAFPTADETDSRMLSFGCAGIQTFEQEVSVVIVVPPEESSLTISIFDGDTSGIGADGKRHWDSGSRQLKYELFADPLFDLSLPTQIGSWFGNAANPISGPLWTTTAANMPDNDWWGVTIDVDGSAQAPSGYHFYVLRVIRDGACNPGEVLASDFKVATSSPMNFIVTGFGFEASLRSALADGPIVYPDGFPPAGFDFLNARTTYDGTYPFFLRIPPGTTELAILDGDFDHGTSGLTAGPSGVALVPCADTDDPDTGDYASILPFPAGVALPEGAKGSGAPSDDQISDVLRRGEPDSPGRIGCVRYEVEDSLGNVYRNDNPSGNSEWEQFRIATPLANDPGNSDYLVGTDYLPAGIWQVRIIGLDMLNLNFWYTSSDVCSNVDGVPGCPEKAVYLVGDTVWFDTNADGVQDPGETGIAGVVLNLYAEVGGPILGSAVTGDSSAGVWQACRLNNTGLDEDGLYCFGIEESGTYYVEVAPENFEPGGALEGLLGSGDDTLRNEVVDDNVLTYDFGYYPPLGSLGDRVWLDSDADGVQDLDEPGINGVTVELYDVGGSLVGSTVTSGDGEYLFDALEPGDYTVVVVVSTLPADVAQTYDLDGLATLNEAMAGVAAGEDRRDADFGYTPCYACDGKVSLLSMVYLGQDGAQVRVEGRRGPVKNDPLFDDFVSAGKVFTVVGPDTGNGGFRGTLGTEITVFVDGAANTTIHTSCSQEIGPGMIFGDFLIVYAESKNNGPMCPATGGEGGGGDDGGDDGSDGEVATGTIGYWKNHGDAWPVTELSLGGVVYTRDEALALLDRPVGGDATISLAYQLVAAKLNVALGTDASCIANTIAEADAFLASYPLGSKPKGGAKTAATNLQEELDAYNNGQLCAPHRG